MSHIKKDNLIFCLLLLVIYFLFVEKFMIFSSIILLILVLYRFFDRKKIVIDWLSIIFFTNIIYLLFLLLFSEQVSFNIYFKEISRVLIYLLIIQIVSGLKVENYFVSKVVLCFVIFGLSIQVIQFFNLFEMTRIIESIYGESKFFKLSNNTSLSHFRSGGVIENPNHFARILLILLTYLLTHQIFNNGKVKNYLFIFLGMISLMLAGSRAGLIIFVLLLIYVYAKSLSFHKIRFRNIFIIILIPLVSILTTYIVILKGMFVDARIFNLAGGFAKSMSTKITNLVEFYVSNSSISTLLFGTGPIEKLGRDYIYWIDFDLGYIVAWYGLYGVFLFLLITVFFIQKARRNQETKIFKYGLIIIFLLGSLTSGTFFNIRIFSIFLLFFYLNIFTPNKRRAIRIGVPRGKYG